jgi:hypothetical protein
LARQLLDSLLHSIRSRFSPEASGSWIPKEIVMAESFKDKVEDAGQKIAESATKVGHKVGEKVEEATDWTKEKAHQAGHRIEEATHKVGASLSESTGSVGSVADIREHMDVYASCGTKVGRVDHVEGNYIKLTRSDSPDGQHHLIPLSWVAKVHDHVHLIKDHVEVQNHWRTV